ncbi:MAG: ubiquinone anaerobic biosynthesis protein UbiV [Devosia sp.]
MSSITIGPLYFYWSPQQKQDFYFRIADEAPVSTVYLGEVICSKRIPFFERQLPRVRERLERGGKKVVLSTLSEVTVQHDRRSVGTICAETGCEIEVNDASALWWLEGRSFRVGQHFNCYSGETLAFLAEKGATHVCLPPELPAASVSALAEAAGALGVGIELQVFGRVSLALSARCYHARAHGRTKDNCQFVCEQDPDGLELRTMDDGQYLVINGIQTLSHSYLNLCRELGSLRDMGVTHFRISPHSGDMVKTASVFDRLARAEISTEEVDAQLSQLDVDASFANGFFHGKPGYLRL